MGCACAELRHDCRLVVLTGGPGAGKTAVLEVVRRAFCEHILVLPESATVLFGGGFPRHDTDAGQRAAQNAIFHVQRSMETMSREEGRVAVALCDRGTLDGLAYWPGGIDAACRALGIAREAELARYQAVIHLRTPAADRGYDHSNPVRRESAAEALALDARVLAAWDGHPHRVVIESEGEFLHKIAHAVQAIRDQVPECCRAHAIAELAEPAQEAGCVAVPGASRGRSGADRGPGCGAGPLRGAHGRSGEPDRAREGLSAGGQATAPPQRPGRSGPPRVREPYG